jgi:hypothetical protein
MSRLMAIFCAAAVGFQANVATALPALYVHYDASNAANVTADVSDVVTSLTDLSAPTTTAYDATKADGAGTLLYSDPGNLSPTGLKGVDTNNGPHHKLLVLSDAEQEALLNFSGAGAAASNTGFAALVVFKADTVAGSTRNLVLASNGNGSAAGSFIMKYEGGVPQVILGGTSVKASATAVVADGETVVLAVNYNQATGNMEVWDSENNTSVSVTKAAADFSSDQSLFLAGSQNSGQGMDGMIGEVKIFQGVLTSEEFTAEQTALVNKWLGAPAIPTYAHYDASDASTVGFDAVNTSKVITLDDLSGNNFGAEDGNGTEFGDVLYPDAIQSATGLDLLDMGATNNRLRTLLPTTEQSNLLDFTPSTGGAAANSGFSFFVVARVDSILAGNVNAILANNDNTLTGGLQLRLDGAGNAPRLHLGPDTGASVSVVNGSAPGAGDTLVLAANYDSVTGVLEFWNSNAVSSATVTVPVPLGKFSTGKAIFVGGSNNVTQFMDGAIGEVKFYQGRMSAVDFAAEQLALTQKWITGSPVTDFTSWVDGTFANGTLSDKTATGDDDNDGISNLIEFAVEGQDPTVSNSTVGTYSGLVVTFLKRQEVPAVGGITYVIEQSTDLGVTDTWAAVTPTVDDVNSISYTLPGDEAKDFVRLKVTQD